MSQDDSPTPAPEDLTDGAPSSSTAETVVPEEPAALPQAREEGLSSHDHNHDLAPDRPDETCSGDARSIEPSEEEAGQGDFPPVRSLRARHEVIWDEDRPPVENFALMGRELSRAGDVYRSSVYGGGLILAPGHPNVPPTPLRDPGHLQAIIVDRVIVKVVKDGKSKGGAISATHLRTMLRSEAFLQQFQPVDQVTDRPMYSGDDFRLVKPGYNDSGFGRRILYTGHRPEIAHGLDFTKRFLDAMTFETFADWVAALGAALIVMLRNYWPGGKPILVVTSSKSHGGKGTIMAFAAITAEMIGVSYQEADWAVERQIVGAIRQNPEAGLIHVDNARPGGGRQVRSGFMERLATDPKPFLFSTGTGQPVWCPNAFVLGLSMNFGMLSEDLMNRGLPIHLAPTGDVAHRRSPIGNPKLEYLPTHRELIGAELRGMVERWNQAGRPLDNSIHHPFTECMRTIGGILQVNGFSDFLGNLRTRRTADDPVRRALGLLGTARPGDFLKPSVWAIEVARLGLVKALIPEADRDSESGRARGTGVVLSAHRDETFEVETDDVRLTLKLEKRRARFDGEGEPSTRYGFAVMEQSSIPPDEE